MMLRHKMIPIIDRIQQVIEQSMDETDIDVNYGDETEASRYNETDGLICVQHSVSWSCFMTIAFSFGESAVSFVVKTARRAADDSPIENLVVNTAISYDDKQAFAAFHETVAAELRDSELYDMGNPYA